MSLHLAYVLVFIIFNPIGMKASSRSDQSMSTYFDGYVNSMTPLSYFIEQYDKELYDRSGNSLQKNSTKPTIKNGRLALKLSVLGL